MTFKTLLMLLNTNSRMVPWVHWYTCNQLVRYSKKPSYSSWPRMDSWSSHPSRHDFGKFRSHHIQQFRNLVKKNPLLIWSWTHDNFQRRSRFAPQIYTLPVHQLSFLESFLHHYSMTLNREQVEQASLRVGQQRIPCLQRMSDNCLCLIIPQSILSAPHLCLCDTLPL